MGLEFKKMGLLQEEKSLGVFDSVMLKARACRLFLALDIGSILERFLLGKALDFAWFQINRESNIFEILDQKDTKHGIRTERRERTGSIEHGS